MDDFEEDHEAILRWAMKTVCGLFRCTIEEKVGLCPNVEACPFGHSKVAAVADISNTLKTVPWYICVPHLLAQCQNGETCNSCPFGNHIKLDELIDLPSYEVAHNLNSQVECENCRERIMSKANFKFAILEQCDHSFCGPCIRNWQQQDPNRKVTCPICGIVSDRVAYNSQFVDTSSAEEKTFPVNK